MTRKKPDRKNMRATLVASLFFVWLLAIGGRAGYLQLYKSAWLSDKAAGQYEAELTLIGKRGTIYDRNHQAVAVSLETTSVAAYPRIFHGKDLNQSAKKIAKALNLQASQVAKLLAAKKSFVWLKRQATPKDVAAVKALKLKGLDYLPEHSRFYPNTTVAAQVVGFAGIDGRGLEGLEFAYNRELKGEEQKIIVHKDALGRGFSGDTWAATPAHAGNNLVLTIDSHIQFITEQALAEAVTQFKAKSGMAVVMKPETGAILALANFPLFNPNNYRKYEQNVFRNRVITDPFEPGSTLKIFSAAAALEGGKVTPSSIFYCEKGSYRVGGHRVHDTKSHGWLTLGDIVKYSSNIGTIKVVEKMGAQTLHSHLKGFGFGVRTLIDCPGESPGSLTHHKTWKTIDTSNIAFGQGISTTAIQLVTATAALANDGVMMQPYIVQSIIDPEGRPVRITEPKAVRQVVSATTAKQVRRMMRGVITEGGTGIRAELDGYEVCGKTGTAQKIEPDGSYSHDRYVSSFIGLVPTEKPVLAVLVVVDEPKGTNYGGVVAAPAFRQIVKETLGYMNIVPENNWKKLQVMREDRING
jgi:cell division protein FtsI (penicillin-binding protein 3)